MRWLLWTSWLFLACGPSSPTPAQPSAVGDGEPVPADAAADTAEREALAATSMTAPQPGAKALASGAPRPAGARTPVLAAGSNPPGIAPLDEAERKEVDSRCGPLMELVKKTAVRDGRKHKPHQYVEALVDSPPTLAGVDVPRCTELLVRDVRAYRAKTLELQAINDIRIILVGLAGAMDQGRLCPPAAPVPARLETLKTGPHRAEEAAWQTPGWKCAHYDRRGQPQHFQYRVDTDSAKQSYRISARGYLLEGHPAVELFLEGEVEGGAIQLSSDVYRR